jgi:uncharacterized repeat protein (TIGR03806 family)
MRGLIASLCGLALLACSSAGDGPPVVTAADTTPCARPNDYLTSPPEKLSGYCVLENQNGRIVPLPDAVPYDLNTPLFSDYALKTRIVWVPPGTPIQYDPAAALDMPVGSIVTKTFAFAKDYRQPTADVHVVETRVLLRRQAGWVLLPYVWNDAQDDATLASAAETRPIAFIDAQGTPRTAHYFLPAERDCHSCHDSGEGVPQLIGPSARQLNRDFVYANGTENQLAHWARLGILAGAPDPRDAPRLATWNDPVTGTVAARARAYLEANCAHCHNPAGLSAKTGLFLRADEADPAHFGACRVTGADATASGGFRYDAAPGDPDHSVIPFRLASTDPHVMMPQIGRSVVHTEGLALVREWIAGLTGSCSEASGGSSPDGGVVDAGSDGGDDHSDASNWDASTDAGELDAGAPHQDSGRADAGGDDQGDNGDGNRGSKSEQAHPKNPGNRDPSRRETRPPVPLP